MTPVPELAPRAVEPDVSNATTEMTSNGAVHAIPSIATMARSRARRGWIAASVAAAFAALVVFELARPSSNAPAPRSLRATTVPADAPPVDALPVDAAPITPITPAIAPAIAVDAGVVVPADAPPRRHPNTIRRPAQPPDPLGTRL